MGLIIERVLFVVAPQDSGKSTQLRSMFLDRRLGTDGRIPSSSEKSNLPETYHISNERRLHLRLTSPHEYGDKPKEFFEKIKSKTAEGRWCIAGALQPDAYNSMPDIEESLKQFIRYFNPERIRNVFLSPNRHGNVLSDFLPGRDLFDELLNLSNVEVACIDARKRESNGLFLADFFDFT